MHFAWPVNVVYNDDVRSYEIEFEDVITRIKEGGFKVFYSFSRLSSCDLCYKGLKFL